MKYIKIFETFIDNKISESIEIDNSEDNNL